MFMDNGIPLFSHCFTDNNSNPIRVLVTFFVVASGPADSQDTHSRAHYTFINLLIDNIRTTFTIFKDTLLNVLF